MPGARDLPLADGQPSERADARRNRRRILEAAQRLFTEREQSSVTMGDIAQAAGVGRATLYRRYPDPASVAIALLDEHEQELQERILRGPPPLGPGGRAESTPKGLLRGHDRATRDPSTARAPG